MADILRLFNDINFELHWKLKSFLVVVKLINTLLTEEKIARGKVSFEPWTKNGNSQPIPSGIYLFKVNKRYTRTRCEICSKLTIKTPERRQASLWYLNCYLWTYFTCCSSVFTANFEHATAGRDDVDKTSIKQSTLSNSFFEWSITNLNKLSKSDWNILYLFPGFDTSLVLYFTRQYECFYFSRLNTFSVWRFFKSRKNWKEKRL